MRKTILSLFFISASLTVNAAPDSKKTESWVGQEEQSVISILKTANPKYKFDGGGIKGGTAQVVYNAANPKKPIPVYFWISPVSDKISKITGVMKIPALKSGEVFAYDCNPMSASAVAVVRRNDSEAHLPAVKAWNVDIASGKFKVIPAKGITCLSPAVIF